MSDLQQLRVGGKDRRYLVSLPANPAGAPVVLALHGSNQTPRNLRGFAGPSFDTLAADHGFVVAYPEGYKKHWNDARTSAGFAARAEGYDDVLFLRLLIDTLAAEHDIDRSRVYLIGYSNGGQLAIRAAHEAGELFAGIMLISATQPAAEVFAPSRDGHVPLQVLIVHGTKDPIVPYYGGPASLFGFRPRGNGLSAPDTAEYWAVRNGITAAPFTEPVETSVVDGTRAERLEYRDNIHPPVRLITIEGGGHVVPGGKKGPWIMGRTSRQITAVDEFLDFFVREG